MTVNITTRYKSNAAGAGKIEARTGDTRRTLTYDHNLSPEANHGSAAGEALLALSVKKGDEGLVLAALASLDSGTAIHDSDDNGGVHRFSL